MKPNQNMRQALGLSQQAYAALLEVSESLVSLVEINQRYYPHEASMKEAMLIIEWMKVYSQISTPTGEALWESLGPAIQSGLFWADEFKVWVEKLEKEIWQLQTQVWKMKRELPKLKDAFDTHYHTLHFIRNFHPADVSKKDEGIYDLVLLMAKDKLAYSWQRILEIEEKLGPLQTEIERKENILSRLKTAIG